MKLNPKKIGAPLILLLLILGGVFLLLQSPMTQTFISKKILHYIGKNIDASIHIDKVDINFFGQVNLQNILILDTKDDTFLSAQTLSVNFSILHFFKKQVYIDNVLLDNAYVNIYRHNLVEGFAFDFLSDTTQRDKKPLEWDIQANQIQLQNSHLRYLDSVGKMGASALLPHLSLHINRIDIAHQLKNMIDIERVKIDGLEANINTFGRVQENKKTKGKSNKTTAKEINVHIQQLNLANASISYDNQLMPIGDSTMVDLNHPSLNNLSLTLNDLHYDNNVAWASLQNLSGEEKSGFAIKKANATIKLSEQIIDLPNLYILTTNSQVETQAQLRFGQPSDLAQFVEKAHLTAKLNKTKIGLSDVKYFTKELKTLPYQNFILSGHISGKVNKLKGKAIKATLGSHQLSGDFTIDGLPNIKQAYIRFNVQNFNTSGNAINQLLPNVKTPQYISRLGSIRYKGSIDGFFYDFISKGTIQTSIGAFSKDINIKLSKKSTAFSGEILLDSFDLGKWLDKTDILGKISAKATVEGNGSNIEDFRSNVKGNIDHMHFKDYNYKNIQIKGRLKDQQFNGALKIDDPNINLDFDGMLRFDSTNPRYASKTHVKRINLKPLHFSEKDYSISGVFNTDMSGKNIDDIRGNIDLSQLIIQDRDRDKTFNLSYVSAFSYLDTSKHLRVLMLESQIGLAVFQGNFSLKTLPKNIENYIAYYYKEKKPLPISDEYVKFSIDLHSVGNLTELIHPKLTKVKPASIEGMFNTPKNQLRINGIVPEVTYGNYQIKELKINTDSDINSFNFNTEIGLLRVKNSVITENVFFASKLNDRQLDFRLTAQENNPNTNVFINGKLTEEDSLFITHIDSSTVLFHGEKWMVDERNLIRIGKNYLDIRNLALTSGQKSVALNTTMHENNMSTNVILSFKNINLALAPKLGKVGNNQQLFGIASGNVQIRDVFKRRMPFGQINIDNLGINKDTVGSLKVNSYIDKERQNAVISASIVGNHNLIRANGSYGFGKKNDTVNMNIDINRLNLPIVDNIASGIIYDTKGYASGKLKMIGTRKKNDILGSIYLEKVQTTINHIHTTYYTDKQTVHLKKGFISMDNLVASDQDGNTAVTSGGLYHNYLQDINIDIKLNTDRMRLLSTKEEQSPEFYGEVFAKGTIWLHGLKTENFNVEAEVETLRGTHIYFPLRSKRDTKEYSFYRFVRNKIIQENIQKNSPKKLIKENLVKNRRAIIDLRLKVTEVARVDLIFNKVSGDKIEANGHGNIRVKLDEKGDMTMQGLYEIDKGGYDFSFQDIIKKRFDIEKGSKVYFQGPASNTHLDLNAIYTTRANPNDLVSDYLINNPSLGANQQFNTRLPIELYLQLDGKILTPDITFDIKAKEFNLGTKSPLDNALQAVKNDANELNKQVFGLLVLNKFLPIYDINNTGSTTEASSTTSTFAVNTISDFLSSQLTKYFNDWFGEYVQGLELNFKYRTYDILQGIKNTQEDPNITDNTSSNKRNEIEIGLTQRFLDNRLSISVGSNFDFGNEIVNQETQRTTHITGDVELAYSLTEDGRFRIKAFSKGQFDALQGQNVNRTGVGISYQQEFDNGRDLVESFKSFKAKRIAKKKERKEKRTKKRQKSNSKWSVYNFISAYSLIRKIGTS